MPVGWWGYSSSDTSNVAVEVWQGWNHTYTSSATDATLTTTYAASSLEDDIWEVWCDEVGNEFPGFRCKIPRTMSQSAIIHRMARRTRLTNRRQRKQQRRVRAKAAMLLHAVLDEQQRLELRTHRYFTVWSQDCRRAYRVGPGTAGNVHRVHPVEGRVLQKLCVHPDNHLLPEADVHLAQLLHLLTDEVEFLRTANVYQDYRTEEDRRQDADARRVS